MDRHVPLRLGPDKLFPPIPKGDEGRREVSLEKGQQLSGFSKHSCKQKENQFAIIPSTFVQDLCYCWRLRYAPWPPGGYGQGGDAGRPRRGRIFCDWHQG